MPYLEQERTQLQISLQATVAELSALTPKLRVQEEAVTAAQAQVSAAQTQLEQQQAGVPGLQRAAEAADRLVAKITQQIEEHNADQPEKRVNNRPNPAWETWNRKKIELDDKRTQAQMSASAARRNLQVAQGAMSQAQAVFQAAERQVNEAKATRDGTKLAIEGVQKRQKSLQQQIDDIAQVNAEIDRDPINRQTVEQIAAKLSVRVFGLDDAWSQARVELEDAEEHLKTLVAERTDLTQRIDRINDVRTGLPAAQARREAALRELAKAEADVIAAVQ